MQVRICRTGNLRNQSAEIACQLEVCFPVGTGDLNVDGSRQSEVENLVDDVRRLEEERRPRELLGKNVSHFLHVFPGVTMFAVILQRNEYFAIERAERLRIRESEVD